MEAAAKMLDRRVVWPIRRLLILSVLVMGLLTITKASDIADYLQCYDWWWELGFNSCMDCTSSVVQGCYDSASRSKTSCLETDMRSYDTCIEEWKPGGDRFGRDYQFWWDWMGCGQYPQPSTLYDDCIAGAYQLAEADRSAQTCESCITIPEGPTCQSELKRLDDECARMFDQANLDCTSHFEQWGYCLS